MRPPPTIEIMGYDSFSPSDVILGLVEVKMLLQYLHTKPYLIVLYAFADEENLTLYVSPNLSVATVRNLTVINGITGFVRFLNATTAHD